MIARLPAWLMVLILAAAVAIGGALYRKHVYHAGELAEGVRAAAREQANSERAKAERIALNAKIATAQRNLDTAVLALDKLKKELSDAQAISAQRAADLAAGRMRERVLVRATARPIDPNGSPVCTAAGSVDSTASFEADLDPSVASWLEGIRAAHNAAVGRLDACIQAYDAVKAAADAMP